MKKINLLAAAVLAAGALSSSAFAASVDISAYMRAGVRHANNVNTGKWALNQVGRLGNEESFADVLFSSDVVKVNDTVWTLGYMLSWSDGNGRQDWDQNISCRQLYGEVKGLFGGLDDGTLWVGKRYGVRDDIHITDTYLYCPSWGTGAGVENVTLGSGKLSASWVVNDQAPIEVVLNTNAADRDLILKNQSTYSFKVDADHPTGAIEQKLKTAGTTNVFDVNYTFPLWDGATLKLGDSYVVFEPETHSGWTSYTYSEKPISNSNLFTALLHQNILGGFNRTVYQFVKGSTAKDLHWNYGAAVDTNGNSNNAYAHRLVNFGVAQFTDHFGMMHQIHGGYSAGYDDNLDNHKTFSLVVRPFYKLTQMTRVYLEAGFSVDSQKNKDGKKTKAQCQKYTVAYAITPDAGAFLSRPEIRFFYSYLNGNGEGDAKMDGSFDKAGIAVTQDNFFGAQIEAWF